MNGAEQKAVLEALGLMAEDFNKAPYGFLTPEERAKLYADMEAISASRKVRPGARPYQAVTE